MKKIIVNVLGMTCSACSNTVEKYLKKQDGIIDASVNLVMGQALIYYEDNVSLERIEQYIEESGYQYGGVYDETKEKKKDYQPLILILLGLLMIFIMYLTMSCMFSYPVVSFLDPMMHPKNYAICLCVLTIPYLIYGRDIFRLGIKNLLHKSPNMDSLVSMGVIFSFLYSFVSMILVLSGKVAFIDRLYFESVCMILLFIKLGRLLDKNSKEKTKEAIQELVKVTPESALLKTKDGEKEVTIDEVNVGDILIVKPGMKVAVDGEIVKGSSHFDESFITGESLPVKKQKGDHVIAGSISFDGVVCYKAEKIGPKSTISQMVHLVLEASNSKMPISKIADRVSAYFVPVVFLLAFVTFGCYLLFGLGFTNALNHMVTVLVVACPCALGLATPLAVVVSIGTASLKGILIKSSESLEAVTHIDTIIFDKTGTLTYGKLQVHEVTNLSSYSDKELLNLVSNIEKNSSHPISMAFQEYKINDLEVEDYQEITGIGVTAKIHNKKYFLGNQKGLGKIKNPFKKEENQFASHGNSVIYVVEDDVVIGLIGVKDVIKKDSKKTIQTLKKLGYDVVMLTGDHELTAQVIGKELGISHIVSNCFPSDKTKYIQKLQSEGKHVMMVGDGINDAPSLALATIGVSFKSSTDIAANSSHIIIMNDQLETILLFLSIGKRTLKNIKQNLFWAFFYNILMIPMAMGLLEGFGLMLQPMFASGAMMLSSLTVVFNALRLRKIDSSFNK